jgi:hypothetical protein
MSIKRKIFNSIISGIIIGFLIVAFPLIMISEKQIYLGIPRETIQTTLLPPKIVKEVENITIFTSSLEETKEIGILSISNHSFYNLYYILFISILASFISFIIIKKYLRL